MCLFPCAIHTLSITSRIGFFVFAGTSLPKYTRQIGDSLWGSSHWRAAFLQSVGGPLEFAEWERAKVREREMGLMLTCTMQTHFCSRKHGAGGYNGSACYRPGVTGERCIPLQGFGSHVLAPGQLWGGRKMYWLQHLENVHAFILCQHNE